MFLLIINYDFLDLKNEFTFKEQNSFIDNFTNLFADSQSTGKLANFSITDFGANIQKAKISFGNVNLSIYKQGSRNQLSKPISHNKEEGFHELVSQLKYKGHYYASLRNFNSSIIMNFTSEDFNRGLYFSTWTFNNFKTDLKFTFGYGSDKGTNKCPYSDCQQAHFRFFYGFNEWQKELEEWAKWYQKEKPAEFTIKLKRLNNLRMVMN